jgi:hypothetical protein
VFVQSNLPSHVYFSQRSSARFLPNIWELISAPAETTAIRDPTDSCDFNCGGEVCVGGLADPNTPRKAAFRVVVFRHLFPLRMDVG